MAVTLYLLLLSLSTCCLLVDQAVAGDAVDVDLASVYTGVEFSNEEPAAHEDGSLFNNNDDFDEYDNTYGNYLDQYTTADPECTEDEHGNTSTIGTPIPSSGLASSISFWHFLNSVVVVQRMCVT